MCGVRESVSKPLGYDYYGPCYAPAPGVQLHQCTVVERAAAVGKFLKSHTEV